MNKVVKTPGRECFLNSSPAGWSAYLQAVTAAREVFYQHYATLSRPFSGIQVGQLKALLEEIPVCPEEGRPIEEVLRETGEKIVRHSVVVHHPACSAHLHCPPLTAALAAEQLTSAMNQSMDSWDQSPAATMLEEKMIGWLCSRFFDSTAGDGIFTSGGTQSNYMGLLLARDFYLRERMNWDAKRKGLPAHASRMRILCSKAAHFTVKQAAALLGLGEEAVILIDTDKRYQMDLLDLDKELYQLKSVGYLPFAIVATAGTTDFGSIDPLGEIVRRAEAEKIWLHVDAAYGGALLMSDRYKHQLAGIEKADSVVVDFHKLFYQPISCGAFLLRNKEHFELIRRHADYLNSEEDEWLGIPHLVGKSVQTTRRFDALKLFVSLQATGRIRFAEMIEHTLEIAQEAAQLIRRDEHFQLINDPPALNAVVFRYRPTMRKVESDQLNRNIRDVLFHQGKAVIAQTRVDGMTCLKLTLLNPLLTSEELVNLLQAVKQTGLKLEMERGGNQTACRPKK